MDVLSLTQTEAQERAALLSVEGYDLTVDLTDVPTGPEVRCTSTVRFSCRQPGATTFVDCAADVVSANLNGEALGPASQGRITLPALADQNALVVESVQANTADGEGVHKATDPADGEVYLWMSFEPDEARYVWACFDQPDLKAPHAITVTAPTAWTVLSNSGDAQIEESGSTRRWTFPATPPLSTYNPVVLAGPFFGLRRDVGGHDLGLYARQSLRVVLERDADELFTVTEQGLTFFGDVFGMPFPQRKYDQVFLPELGGAMENYGCVAWSDSFLRRSTPTAAEMELFVKVLLHEMAHMWFGNLVTMRWWDDLWLNEAFAEFACNWAAVRATSYPDCWAGHLASAKLDAYLADQGPISHPIRQPIRDVAEAASIFDDITYPKGASVLQQLMTYLGEDVFSAGMKSYFAKHAWGNTTLEDLFEELATASGRDLDRWRSGWLETAGTDRLTLEREGGRFVLVAGGPAGCLPRPHVVAVGAYRRTATGLERAELSTIEVAGERTPLELPRDAELYLVNDQDLTFATARPEETSRTALFEGAAQLPSPISRAVAVTTVWDMLITGEAATSEVVRCVTSVLRAESSASVVEPYINLACDAALLWSARADRTQLSAEVAATASQLAEDPARRQVALRAVARTTSDHDGLARVRQAVGDDIDLLWRVLVRQAETGEATEGAVQDLLVRDPDPDAWVRALTVRAATPTAEAKAEVWQTLVLDRKVPIGMFGQVAGAFWRPDQDELLTPYAESYLELLPRFHEGGMINAMVFTTRLFPVFAIEADYLAEVEAAAGTAAPVVRKTMAQRADLVRRMLLARATSAPGS